MKYGLVKIECRVSDYEFTIDNLVTGEDIEKEADELSKTYYSEEGYNEKTDEFYQIPGEKYEGFDQDCYFHNGGEIRTKVERFYEITKEEYDIMNKYI